MAPFECACGMRTREPFVVNGVKMCTLCADRIAPRLVNHRAAASWREFTASGRRVPTTPYRQRWLGMDDD